MAQTVSCRSCASTSLEKVIDLGLQPLANNLLRPENLNQPEPRFPLDVWVCTQCWLMQITHIVPPVTLFSEYVYFSSFSDHMLRHAREASLRYIEEKKLGAQSFVIEIASNDGYLLKNFVQAGVPCLGFEPAANIAEVARKTGVDTHCEFFGTESAAGVKSQRGSADLILGNNVFAHAPDTNDFVKGLATLLKPDGWIVLEFPYGAEMIEKVEFDTIYHEHVFYFTLLPLIPLFERHGLEIFHVEKIAIHGGSLRVFASHKGREQVRDSVLERTTAEIDEGLNGLPYYQRFSERAEKVRRDLIAFLQEQKTAGKSVAAYGASAKGSTLLNYVGDAAGDLAFMADRSTYKHGLLSPGLHIPIVPAEALAEKQPDYALLLAWNFAEEIMKQQAAYAEKGGRFVIPLPELRVV
ncbi:methyltransferase family protein [Roseimicrobium gellanilyticum]|uniref:Methyltransferase family protein n=1 Tax=Roseimicrobium gellanilyticum TaxID=748857 RepID=A0A366H3U6_9BACT|nr:class I SAM-dependent methyltransferase [Roseimicrobium gellanilyticum]RBP36661.1 methyltransferase family protein [Roseimicrobium gellanilyticum]